MCAVQLRSICGTATKKPLTRTAGPGNLLWRMEPCLATDGREFLDRDTYVITSVTFVFPADLYSFQGLAGSGRSAVGRARGSSGLG